MVQNINMNSLSPLPKKYPPQNFNICSSVITFERQIEKKNYEYTISYLNLSIKNKTARINTCSLIETERHGPDHRRQISK